MSAIAQVPHPSPLPEAKGASAQVRARAREFGIGFAALQRRYPLLQALVMVALFLYGAETLNGFSSLLSLRLMLVLAAFLGFAGVGLTITLLIGGLDLSISAFILLGASMIIQLAGELRWPFVLALAAIIAIAATLGAVSGFICHFFRIQSLIVTLGMNAIVTGAMQVWPGWPLNGSPPAWLVTLASAGGKTFGLAFPPLPILWAIVAIAVSVVLHRTVAGRWMYATGSNPRAASLALVPTLGVWMVAFAASAVFSVLVGVLLAGFAAGDQSVGDPYLFQGLAAVIVGGTAFGGRGDYWRTVLGALLLTEITTVLVGHGLSLANQQILYGLVILVVVVGYGRSRRLSERV